MPSTDENKPIGKSGRRKGKSEQRNRKPGQAQSPTPDQLRDAGETIGATVAATATSATDAPAASTDASPVEAAAPAAASPIAAAASVEAVPVSLQTIASAYGDFTKKSLEETRSYVEKLTGARSLDKAVEIQSEFAKQACETFVAESRRIRELHSELARQIFKPLEDLVAKTSRTPR